MFRLLILLVIVLCSTSCTSRGPEEISNNDDIYFEEDYNRPYITIYEREF